VKTVAEFVVLKVASERRPRETRDDGDGWVSRVWEDRQGRTEYVKVFALLPAAGCRQLRFATGPQGRPERHARETDDSKYQPKCWILMDGGLQIVCAWAHSSTRVNYRTIELFTDQPTTPGVDDSSTTMAPLIKQLTIWLSGSCLWLSKDRIWEKRRMPFLGAWTPFGGVEKKLTNFWQEGQPPFYRLVVVEAAKRHQAHSKNVCSFKDSQL
jgi:hypothetical protein